MNITRPYRKTRNLSVGRTTLALAIATSFGLSGQVFAQATTSTIFGQAPVASGEAVQVVGGSGYNRTIPIDSNGRYSVTLPIGTYSVTLLQNGQAIQTRSNITPPVSSASEVDFVTSAAATNGKNAKTLTTVTVTGTSVAAIDVTSTNESTVITSQQLAQLPLQRSGAAIALLSPGATQGAAMLGTSMTGQGGGGGPTGEALVSFGGASIAENAYYINGFDTSDPLGNSGGITLPYGSIAQQETLTSGYGAKYGRSAGGVISQVGKSGTNEWHFGAQIQYQPTFAQGNYANTYFSNPLSTASYGQLYQYRNGDSESNTVYDAYVSGPLIKDKLFFFLSAEGDKTQDTTVNPTSINNIQYSATHAPKVYGKLDWNINDSNTLSLTGIKTSTQFEGSYYDYNNTTKSAGDFSGYPQSTKNAFNVWIANYTSYITDNLTLNALYGKMDGTYYVAQPGAASPLPTILNPTFQNPAYTGGAPGGISNTNLFPDIANPDHTSSVTNLRLDLDWKLGEHDLQFGIDNNTTRDIGAGSVMTGPGYAWEYGQASSPTTPIVGTNPALQPYVGPTAPYPGGAQGYYVNQYKFITAATVQVTQHAQYIQDNWQVTPNLLLNIGLRNDQFTNYNPDSVPYLRLTSPQWAPRIGFSWDVFGDSSMKVFGNAGRYYLAMPAGVALREASSSLYTNQYYTYTGINADGTPTGLTPIASNPNGPVSTNNEYGEPLDPKTVASENLKAEYQDEFVLGMQQQLTPSYLYGVTGLVRHLGRIIDDVDDTQTECVQLLAQNPGLAGQIGANCANVNLNGSVLINPGSTNTFRIANGNGGYYTWTVSPQQFGFPAATRNYYSLESYLEHPFDGKWYGKIDYVFSRSYGSTEGPVQSNIGQGGNSVSATTQWDFGSLMQYANGDQANDRKHVLKAYGTYQIAPEWTVSGIVQIASGTPISCLGFYGPNQTDPTGYATVLNGAYHWCGGQPAPPGSTGFTPWTHTLSLSAEYRPDWGGKKLAFHVQVNNVFNEQKLTQAASNYGSTTGPNPLYLLPVGYEIPRYVAFGVTYDW